MVGGLVYRGAFQSTVEGALYSVITHGHANLKVAEDMAREIIADMDIGPAGYDHRMATDEVDQDEWRQSRGKNANLAGSDPRLQHKKEGGKEHAEKTKSDPAVGREGLLYGEKWAAPRQRNVEEHSEETTDNTTHLDRTSANGDGTTKSDLGSCQELLRATHRTACTRYTNQVAHLVGENASLATEVATAVELRDEAAGKAREWEARHRALEKRHEEFERRVQAELALVKEEAQDGNRRASEATALLNKALENATPLLMELVGSFAPIDAEKIGVDLFENLGIGADRYAHVLATKRMLEVCAEHRRGTSLGIYSG